MTNFDHYAAAQELFVELRENGYVAEADIMAEAMVGGSTGSEVFMALRFHLRETIRRVPLEGKAKALAARLFEELNRTLDDAD